MSRVSENFTFESDGPQLERPLMADNGLPAQYAVSQSRHLESKYPHRYARRTSPFREKPDNDGHAESLRDAVFNRTASITKSALRSAQPPRGPADRGVPDAPSALARLRGKEARRR